MSVFMTYVRHVGASQVDLPGLFADIINYLSVWNVSLNGRADC